jgi:Putative amidase domain
VRLPKSIDSLVFNIKPVSLILVRVMLVTLVLTALPPLVNLPTANAQFPGGGFFHTIAPSRLYDSRPSGTNIPNPPHGVGQGPIGVGQIRTIQATGYLGVPGGASAILANITAIDALGTGSLTAFSASEADSSTISVPWYHEGAWVVANFNIIPLSSAGQFKIRSSSIADFAIDVFGYIDYNVTNGGNYQSIGNSAARLYDSRPAGTNNPNPPYGVGQGKLWGGQARCVPARNVLGVPYYASAVAINLTAVGTAGGGHFAAYPSGGAIPNVSSVNWNDHTLRPNVLKAVPNYAIVPIGGDGQICVRAGGGGADLIIDILGYIADLNSSPTAAGTYYPIPSPKRVHTEYQWGSWSEKMVQVAGLGGVPYGATAVAIHLTTQNVAGGGFLTMYRGDISYPGSSNVNTTGANQQVGNIAIVPLADNGWMKVYNGNNPKGYYLDVVGYIKAPTTTSSGGKYNRNAAVAYADQYAINSNPAYISYEGSGTDCQNYASQVLFAGGVPVIGDNRDNIWHWFYYKPGEPPNNPYHTLSKSWSSTQWINMHASQYQTSRYNFMSSIYDVSTGGDLFLMGLSSVTEPTHTRVIIGWGYSENRTDTGPPLLTYGILANQHTENRKRVLWDDGIPAGSPVWFIKVIY